jgi:hypothetical protein
MNMGRIQTDTRVQIVFLSRIEFLDWIQIQTIYDLSNIDIHHIRILENPTLNISMLIPYK